ncbi:uncharacterized protein BDZ99DRAFT_514150 [Mytilinidion resinicola]|uniref:Uncharacterized protein n=1 Tax=Mytilinidion resinicola TaxID=574789 RepID=A0A6A6ZCK3_9PEZI|nr:uncharacterized protein BDZ99DRAFT_514150 [Mytilinidion resinicola]KAF2817927.1 hypothetical protein BDZ99DRAFT_514150 [Mytilinidion resinicola]
MAYDAPSLILAAFFAGVALPFIIYRIWKAVRANADEPESVQFITTYLDMADSKETYPGLKLGGAQRVA